MSYPMPPLTSPTTAPAVPMPASDPTLPQDDTPAQQAARIAQLAATQAIYTWTTEVPTLPGVPLATSVPKNDEPTIAWFAILIGVGIDIVRNALTVKLGGVNKGELDTPRADYEAALAECDAIEASTAKIAAEHGVHSGGNIFERLIGDVENAVAAAERDAHVALLQGYKDRLEELMKVDEEEVAGLGSKTPRSVEAYRALFATLPVPGISYTFQDDSEFARLRVQGPNNMLIAAVGDALPANFPLSAAKYSAVVNGDTLGAALADGRLFLLDYKPLEILDPGTYGGLAKYAWQPMALFAIPPGGSSLVPLAIQCGQDPIDYAIFTPSPVADKQWGWEMAKFVVAVADGNYHELFTHLARTHLVIEAFAVATHRHLAEVHPIWALLLPHFEGTLFINEQAATSLIAANGPIDHIFAGTINSSQLAAVDARLAFDFYGKMPRADFAARGVGVDSALEDYPYRDDALLVWDAIHEWARPICRPLLCARRRCGGRYRTHRVGRVPRRRSEDQGFRSDRDAGTACRNLHDGDVHRERAARGGELPAKGHHGVRARDHRRGLAGGAERPARARQGGLARDDAANGARARTAQCARTIGIGALPAARRLPQQCLSLSQMVPGPARDFGRRPARLVPGRAQGCGGGDRRAQRRADAALSVSAAEFDPDEHQYLKHK
jgi:arachidonate 15-lipoxygenase